MKNRTHQRVRKARVPEGCSRSFNGEKTVIKNLLNGFDPEGSKGEEFIRTVTGQDINDLSQYNINCLGMILASKINVKFTRNHKRSKSLAIMWFVQNIELITPYGGLGFE